VENLNEKNRPSNFKNILPDADKTVLTGKADAENTFKNPDTVIPA